MSTHLGTHRLRLIAVTSDTRLTAFPNTPTVAESGQPGYDYAGWVGVFAPAGLPKPIVDKAWRDTAALLKTAEVRERFASLGADPIGSTPDEFTAFIKTEIAKWEKVIRGANIQVD